MKQCDYFFSASFVLEVKLKVSYLHISPQSSSSNSATEP